MYPPALHLFSRAVLPLAAVLSLLVAPLKTEATILYWDNNGLSPNTSGTWDTTTAQWATDTNLTASPVIWDPTAAAGFPGGPSGISALTITVNGPIGFAGSFNGLNPVIGVTNLVFTGSGSLTLASGLQGIWTGAASYNTIYRLPITGPGTLQNQSSGSLYLWATNSYTGGTSIGTSAGLNIANGFVFGTGQITNATATTVLALPANDSAGNAFATAPVTITNSWAAFGGSSTEILVGLVAAPVTFTGPWSMPGAAGTATTLDVRTTTWTISGPMSGAGNLIKKNTATLVLSGANTYSGSTTVQNGTLSVTSLNKVTGGTASSSLGHPTTVANGTIALGATTTAGTLLYTGAGETTDRVLDLAGTTGGATLQNDGSGAVTFSSTLTASGVGAKTLTLQGANTGNNTIAKIIDSSSGATTLTKAGAGKWILSGANTYSGTTTVSAGTLAQGAANVIPFGTGKGTFAVASGATFDLGGFDCSVNGFGTSAGTIDNTTGVGTYTLSLGNNNGAGTHSGPIKNTSGTVTVVKAGSGAIVLSSASSTYSGKTIVNGGTLTINNAETALGTPPASPVADQLTLNTGTTFSLGSAANVTLSANRGITLSGSTTINLTSKDLTVPGIIAGTGSLTKSGANALILSGANTFSGGLTMAGGTLTLNNNTAAGSGTITITPAATCQIAGKSGTTTLANPIVVNAGGGQTIDFIATSGNNLTLNGQISGSAPFSRGINGGAGNVTLNADNSTYSGGISLLQGPLVLGHKNALGTGSLSVTPGSVAISLTPNTPLTGASAVANLITLNGTLPVTNVSDFELSGIISGAGGLTKGGTGKLILTGVNTYTGLTTITNGTLLVNGSLAAGSTVTVSNGATFGGTGIIHGPATVAASGKLGPGVTIGTLTLDLPPSLNGTVSMDLNKAVGPVLTSDKLVLSPGGGTLSFGGALVLNLSGQPLTRGDTFDLFDADAFAGSFTSITPATPGPGLVWDTSRLTVDGTIKAACDGTLVAAAGTNRNICSGSSSILGGSPTASGGTGGSYTYSWSPATGLNDPALANPTASPSSTTTYTVTVTETNGCTASAFVTVSVDVAPVIASQPVNQTVCSGSSATFSVGATGSGLSYSWSKHSNSGWGSAWTTSGGGATFRASATDNDFGDTACASLSAAFDINSPSGNAFGLWGGFSGDETATRSFPPLAGGQSVSVDFDNGNVDTGSKVGFSLQTSGGADVLQFYFLGGAANYKYNDGVEQDSGIPFQRTGLRVQFVLTSSTTYALLVTPCGGATTRFTGSYSGTIAQLKIFSQNTSGGNDKNIYFNNFVVGGYLDNADNYSGNYAGLDKGDQPIPTGNGGSSYTTPALSVADNGAQYEVVVSGCGGSVVSSVATVTVNNAPLASAGGNQTICAGTSTAPLGGSVGGGATNGYWASSGTGTFAPDTNTLNAVYTPSPADRATGAVTLTLTTTGQVAPCAPATAQVVVAINPAATASTGGNQTICAGSDTAALGGSVGGGATGGLWSSSGSGSFSPDATNLNAIYIPSPADRTAGSVTLTLTSTGQLAPCGATTAQVIVTINAAATASAGGNQTICADSSTAPLAGSVGGGATGGLWSSSGTGSFSPDATNLNAIYVPSGADISAGSVTLTLTSTGQLAPCGPATAQVLVTINAAALASAGGNQSVCAGNSTAGLGGSVGGGATGGLWSSSGTGTFSPDATTLNATYAPSPADISAGSVTLTLSSTGQAAPCPPATAQVVVTINALPAITSAPTNLTVCAGSPASFSVAATGTGLTYQWQVSTDAGTTFTNISDVATNTSYTNLVASTSDSGNQYQVIVSGVCSPAVTSAPVVLTVNAPATAGAGPNQSVCAGSSTAGLGGNVGGGATGGLWSSSGTGSFVPDATTLNASYAPSAADITAGSVTLTLTSTGQAAPCGAATAQVLVTINPAPVANAGSDQIVCPNRPVTIGGSPTASGAAGPFTYLWTPAIGLSDPTAANPTAAIGTNTVYTVTITDTNGCTGTDSVALSIAPEPLIQSITESGASATLVWTSVAGLTYRVQYKNDLNDPNWTDLAPDVTATGPTAMTVDSVGATAQRFYRVSFVCP